MPDENIDDGDLEVLSLLTEANREVMLRKRIDQFQSHGAHRYMPACAILDGCGNGKIVVSLTRHPHTGYGTNPKEQRKLHKMRYWADVD
jgi:hypothetical protein